MCLWMSEPAVPAAVGPGHRCGRAQGSVHAHLCVSVHLSVPLGEESAASGEGYEGRGRVFTLIQG